MMWLGRAWTASEVSWMGRPHTLHSASVLGGPTAEGAVLEIRGTGGEAAAPPPGHLAQVRSLGLPQALTSWHPRV